MRLFGQTSGLPILLLVKADTQIPMDRTRKRCWYMKKKIKIIKKKMDIPSLDTGVRHYGAIH